MPLYEYQCQACEKTAEVLVRGDADQPAECPVCGSREMQRLLSVPAAPAVRGGGTLPVAGGGGDCGAPRCCGGGCQW